MPVDPDFARDERIKRLRSLVKSGTAQMLILYDAIPSYLRLSDTRGQRPIPGFESAEKILAAVPEETKRQQAIEWGYTIAERNHRTYSKIYNWLAHADDTSSRNLSDDWFVQYRALPATHVAWIDTSATETIEEQIVRLSRVVESRIALFLEQLDEDGQHEDIAPALRDAPGGWPHLRRSGLLTAAVLDGYLTRMRKRRTKAEISDSIGAAKEVVEATMKALATRHGALPASGTPDLAEYWKSLRPHLVDASVERALGAKDGAVLKLISAQVSTIHSLGELRNRVGTGHGRMAHPAGLQPPHALLAIDVAHSITRFLAD